MKESCITPPPDAHFVIIRQSYVDLCDGNHCAAGLLSFFEWWHNLRLAQSAKSRQQNEIAQMHGDEGTQDASLYQFHTELDLAKSLLGMYGETSIRKAVSLLVAKDFISLHKNPNPRYHFDKTRYFLFHSHSVNAVLLIQSMPQKKHHGAVLLTPRSRENTGTSPEDVSEDVSEDLNQEDLSQKISLHRAGKKTLPARGHSTEHSGDIDASLQETFQANTPVLPLPLSIPIHDPLPCPVPLADTGITPAENGMLIPPLPQGTKTRKSSSLAPLSETDWPGVRAALETFGIPIPPLDDNDWWNDLSYTCNSPTLDWMTREFARIQAWLTENPRKRPTTRWKTFLRGWLERAYERQRK